MAAPDTGRVELTDGRDVLSVPATAAYALEAIGWKRLEPFADHPELSEPETGQTAPKKPARRTRK